MFWGEFSHQLDKKGRLIIPARYRQRLSTGAILTRGIDHNLVVYPHDVWKSLSTQISQMSIANPTARALRRLVFSGAMELTLDRQGRILIPNHLREYASLDGEALVIGMETFIEIWQPASWRETLMFVSETLADSDTLLELGL